MTGLELLVLAGLVIAIAYVAIFWYRSAQRELVRKRLHGDDIGLDLARSANQRFARRYRSVPWMVVILIGIVLVGFFQWSWNITAGLVVVVGFFGMELDAWIYQWKLARMETQLADAIDIIVASVNSGASLQTSLTQASEYAPMPLRGELLELVARIRLGDSPADAFAVLQDRIPTEVFRLFATTLTVNWMVGGELSNTLASIGNAVRDRIAVARQLRTLSTQGTLTTITVVSIVWFMAAMMWQSDPQRFRAFILSDFGSWLTAACLALQGGGIALVSKIIRPKI